MNKLAMILAMAESFMPTAKPKKVKPGYKACLQCGKQHTHNNAFCSAKCCKEYRNATTTTTL